jgi:DNA-directed RNA polymerase specialized sigma subunit
MSTKDYLSQAYRIDQRINSKLAQVMSLRDLLGKATGTLSGAPKAATPNPHTMEETIAKMVDLENEINEDIDALVDLKAEIMRRIKRVENTEFQTILELRYLCFKRWEEIAVEMGYSLRRLYELHDFALEEISKSPH